MAALSPLVFVLLLEVSRRLAGAGYPTSFLVRATIHAQDVLVPNHRFARRFFGPEMARTPFPTVIPQPKPPNTVRIFVFGESAACGDPQPEFGLPRMLQALLSGRYPGVRFEVGNAAMTAINSHAILPIASDCARHRGDIWVIYMGNNEVVGPSGAGTVFGPKAPNLTLIRGSLALKATRTGQWLDGFRRRLESRPVPETEWGGMRMSVQHQVRQDDPRMATVYAHFERNLKDMLQAGLRSGAKIVVSSVVSNRKDGAPFASLHRPNFSASDLTEWTRLYDAGATAQQAGQAAAAMEYFRQADKLNPTFAELHFRWGQCSLSLGQDAEALRQFTLARDLDALRFRSDTQLNDILRRTASGREPEGILFAEAREVLARKSPRGIVGEEFLYDHVHLNFAGNYLLAHTLAEQVAKLLPETVARRTEAGRPWPSADDCARRLAWTDWNRYEAKTAFMARLNDPPFTTQLNHTEQQTRLRRDIEQLLPATQPAGRQHAVACCRDALATTPNDWVLHKHLGRLLQKAGDFAGAAASSRRVAELLPWTAEAWQALGQALAQQGLEADASEAFHKALRLDPNSVDALGGLAELFARQGKNAEAVRQFKKLLALKPHWGPAHYGLGKVLETMGSEAEAQRHFRQALQNRVLVPAALIALGQLSFEKGWFSEAATNFTDALRLNPADAPTHVNLGLTLSLLGRHPEAQAHHAEAVRLDPKLAEAHVRLGVSLGRQGNDVQALEHFAAAVRLKPDLVKARLNPGMALTSLGREAEAVQAFGEVLRLAPTNATALKYMQALRGRDALEP